MCGGPLVPRGFEARLTELTVHSTSQADVKPNLDHVRVRGGARIAFEASRGRTQARDVFETGGYRILMPAQTAMTEAILINTGGGMAGGDRVSFAVTADAGAEALVTSQAAERIYRSTGPSTETRISLEADAGATLLWLPQETILYSGARLERRLEASVDGAARLVVSEIVVLGRRAMGERLGQGLFKDRWQVRRDGALVYAEAVHLDGDIEALMARSSVTGGRHVVATLLAVMPDAADRIEAVRAELSSHASVEAGASTWNGVLAVRMIGQRLDAVRAAVRAGLVGLGIGHVPRVWST